VVSSHCLLLEWHLVLVDGVALMGRNFNLHTLVIFFHINRLLNGSHYTNCMILLEIHLNMFFQEIKIRIDEIKELWPDSHKKMKVALNNINSIQLRNKLNLAYILES